MRGAYNPGGRDPITKEGRDGTETFVGPTLRISVRS